MPIYELDGIRPELPANGDYWIAPTAVVIGAVRLKPGASVWFGAVIRGDNEWIEIGENSNIQDMAMLHTDRGYPMTIGRDCTIGHKAILHGCTVGAQSLIGMGATVLNGAAIAETSLVGANALVTEGKSFAPASLIVGSPAKAIRTLDEAAILRLKGSADGYVANSRRFRAGLVEIG
ncbi:gamma carbonic anhydrase family protein [Methyloraptor flagellatus]|jgi:carbonic anhydrase/acetyltransferase-like protein (isoleucine patch superfamily)|uniref:Gamma carbonic anhydrase family protein n=1 Tax=Methyloraptor flagellatus TaxID=3162530 RepID=A0AAU7XFM1_9HYPH